MVNNGKEAREYMESGDQSQRDNSSDEAAGQAKNAELKETLYSFAHKIYDVRTDAAKWRKVLEDSPDEVVAFFTEKSSVLANLLSAGSESEINNIIDQATHVPEEGLETTGEAVASPGDVGEEAVPEEAASASVDTAVSEKQSGDDEVERSKEALAEEEPADVSSQAVVNKEDTGQVASSEDVNLVNFLRQLYAVKDKGDSKLQDLLSSTSDEVLGRVESNPFYFEKVMGMTTENHLNEFLEEVQAAAGPMDAKGVEYSSEIMQGNIDYLLGNWAYINFDCRVSNPENKYVKDAGVSEGLTQWMSLAGVPLISVPGKEGAVTVAVSMLGMMNGFSSDTEVHKDDASVDTVVYGTNESPEMRRMIVAFDLVRYIKDFEMGDVKIRAGQRELMRNFWTIAKINSVPCAGFEPTPEELAWYEKREMLFRENFLYQDALQRAKSPGMAPSGGGGMASGQVDQQEEKVADSADEKAAVKEKLASKSKGKAAIKAAGKAKGKVSTGKKASGITGTKSKKGKGSAGKDG